MRLSSLKAKSYNLKATFGFTLIELLVVIAIIGLLSSIVLASLSTARSKAKDAVIQEELINIRSLAEIFYQEKQSYNPTGDTPDQFKCLDDSQNGPTMFGGTLGETSKKIYDSLRTIIPLDPGDMSPLLRSSCSVTNSTYAILIQAFDQTNLNENYFRFYCLDSTDGKIKQEETDQGYYLDSVEWPEIVKCF